MYNRQHGQRRPPTVPQNYSGNAFYRVPYSEPEPAEEPLPMPEPEPVEAVFDASECEECGTCPPHDGPQAPSSSLPFNLGGKLFPRGLGSEELLILALILMTSQSEDGNEILFYLILLLFC